MREDIKMMRVKWLVAAAFALMAFVSCEQEATAPYTTTVDIIQSDTDWKMPCNDSTCEPDFQGLLIHYATAVVTFSNKVAPNDQNVGDVDLPLNGVNIRWIPTAGDLWLPEDDYKPYYGNHCYLCSNKDCPEHPKCKDLLWPLDVPYNTETDERGISDIVWILLFSDDWIWTDCGSQLMYHLSADVGVAGDSMSVTISVDACEE